MSLFKEPFHKNIVSTLKIRQNVMDNNERTITNLKYLNSNTNWVSLKSSVDIREDNGAAAQLNVLLGGTLSGDITNENRLRTGEGPTISSDPRDNTQLYTSRLQLGIRPMAGITSVSIENLGAYGSTRKATVNFQCWDVSQLDILEQLYMRPGYLVLLEFGRTHWYKPSPSNPLSGVPDKLQYIGNSDIELEVKDFFQQKDINLLEYLNKLHKRSVDSLGNYDAFLGYVVNYGWQLRPDGGYDCKTEIISTGEILESLKSNFSYANITSFAGIDDTNFSFKGLIEKNINSNDFLKVALDKRNAQIDNVSAALSLDSKRVRDMTIEDANKFSSDPDETQAQEASLFIDHYKKMVEAYASNAILGLITELEFISAELIPNTLFKDQADANGLTIPVKGNTPAENFDLAIWRGHYDSTTNDIYFLDNGSTTLKADVQTYISLESFVGLLNRFIVPYSYKQNSSVPEHPITKISVHDREYLGRGKELLKCLFNPLMTSVDPDVCFIRNPYWVTILKGISFNQKIESVSTSKDLNHFPESNNPLADTIRGYMADAFQSSNVDTTIGVRGDKLKLDAQHNLIVNVLINRLGYDRSTKKYSPPSGFTSLKDYFNFVQKCYQTIKGGDYYYIPDPDPANPTAPRTAVKAGAGQKSWNGISDETDRLYFRGNFSDKDNFWGTSGIVGDAIKYSTSAYVVGGLSDFIKADSSNRQLLEASYNFTNLTDELTEKVKFKSEAEADIKNTEAIDQENNRIGDRYAYYIRNNEVKPFVTPTPGKREFGIIGYIYLNTKILYELASSLMLKSQDPEEKDSISIIQFLKALMREVQSSIGNVNDFEILIDDRDSIARIIDLNYVDRSGDLFEFQIGTNQSIVRDVKLESRISKDVTTIMAISAQATGNGGQYGLDNTSLLNFNKGIKDRLLPKKDIPVTGGDEPVRLRYFISSLTSIVNNFFKPYMRWYGGRETGWETTPTKSQTYFNKQKASLFKDQLRDVINYFTSISNTSNRNSSFLPTNLSLELDGISGIVIGNLFTINKDFVPKAYKSVDLKQKLGYVVTNVQHNLQKNDWVTSITGIPFVKDDFQTISGLPSLTFNIIYDPNVKQVIINDKLASASANELMKKIQAVNPNISAKAGVTAVRAETEKLMLYVFKTLNTAMPGTKFRISRTFGTSGAPGTKHGERLAFDFAFIDPDISTTDGNGKSFKDGKSDHGTNKVPQAVDGPTTGTFRVHGYRASELQEINKVMLALGAKIDDNCTRLVLDGVSCDVCNEYVYPTVPASGPHFHIEVDS